MLVERILDILASLSLVRREGDTFTAENGLLPLVTPPAKTFFLANLQVNYFQSRHLIDSAKKPTMTVGWNFTEPEILQSQGFFSASGGDSLRNELYPRLGDLTMRLQAPSARFLDVGIGVGALSIMVCRSLPNLHVVGIDPQEAPLAVARRNIAVAGLTDRIELRKQGVEDITDKEAFDLAFFPQAFMPDDVVKRGLRNIWRALRPGGWVLVATVSITGMELQATVSRLQDTLLGGSARIPSQVQAMLTDASFNSVNTYAFPGGGTINIVAGQRSI